MSLVVTALEELKIEQRFLPGQDCFPLAEGLSWPMYYHLLASASLFWFATAFVLISSVRLHLIRPPLYLGPLTSPPIGVHQCFWRTLLAYPMSHMSLIAYSKPNRSGRVITPSLRAVPYSQPPTPRRQYFQ